MMEVWRRKKRSFELEKGKSGERENSDGAVQGREINHVMFETIQAQPQAQHQVSPGHTLSQHARP